MLLAFYFRQSGHRVTGDKTFEFTHKSFGEYLTARRIVRGVQLMHDELKRRREYIESGWDERDALTYWAKLCGPTTMDRYTCGRPRAANNSPNSRDGAAY